MKKDERVKRIPPQRKEKKKTNFEHALCERYIKGRYYFSITQKRKEKGDHHHVIWRLVPPVLFFKDFKEIRKG